MNEKLKILLLEDVTSDAELIEHQLRKEGLLFSLRRVQEKDAFERELASFGPDIILSDYRLPNFDGSAALEIAKKELPEAPFIFVSGAIGEDLAVDTLKKGATDYILKDHLVKLGSAIERALREAEGSRARHRAEQESIRRQLQLEVLSRTTQHINAILDSTIITRTLIAAALELVDASGGAAGLVKTGKVVFEEYNMEGDLRSVAYGRTFEIGEGLAGRAAYTKKPYISNTPENDPNISKDTRVMFRPRNLAQVPILAGNGELIGCFEIHNKRGNSSFDAQDVFMLQGLAASAAIALKNARLLNERNAKK